MNHYLQKSMLILSLLLIALIGLPVDTTYAAQPVPPSVAIRRPISVPLRNQPQPVAVKKAEAKGDYFISADTVIIGCTAGMAAGVLVGSVPVAGAMMSGIGVPESVALLVNLTGMGCGVGAVSSAVAIFTAWMLESH